MLFAFGPDRDSYYIQNSKRAYWNNLPPALERSLRNDKHFAPEKLLSLSLFPYGGYHAVSSKGDVVSDRVPDTVVRALTRAGKSIEDVRTGVELDSANFNRFITIYGNTLVYGELPREFLEAVFSYAFKGGVRLVALGRNNNWAVIGGDGSVKASVRNPYLQEQLMGKKEIRGIVLSPYDDQFGFIEFMDGNSVYAVPTGWRPAIENIAPKLGKVHGFLHILSRDEEFQKFAAEQSSNLAGSLTNAAFNAV